MLKQLGLGMHAYHDTHGRFPPAVVYGKYRKPLLSWRVLLLPFIEQGELYKQFHLDEPWDSPHNIQLLERMPPAYEPPAGKMSKMPAYHTVCHVFVGKGAAFEGTEGLTFADFADGTSNTLLIVEAGPPVPWTKPDDLAFDAHGPLPELPCIFKDGFRAVMADGSVHWLKKDISEQTLRALVTRNGNDHPCPDDDY